MFGFNMMRFGPSKFFDPFGDKTPGYGPGPTGTAPGDPNATHATKGNDKLIFGKGDQNANGDNGNDILIGGSGDDTLRGGNGSDFVFGGSGDDDLRGGYDQDFLNGGTGDDLINGGRGDDVMIGGPGDDVFVFDGVWGEASGNDVILGFKTSDDSLLIRNVDTVTVSQAKGGVLLEMSSGGSLKLYGVSADDIDESLFVGHAPEIVYSDAAF